MGFAIYGGKHMMRMVLASALILTASASVLSVPAPAHAQALSSGDYAQCSVYDRDGRNRGLDSVCLERKRAQIARFQNRQNRYNPPAAYYNPGSEPCPLYANGGRGFASTVTSNGSFAGYAAAYDAPSNGRPCMPQLNIRLPGVP